MSSGDVTSQLAVVGRADLGQLADGLGNVGSKIVVVNQALDLAKKAWGGLVQGMRVTVGAATEQDRIFARLTGNMRAAGIQVDDARAEFADFTAEMQRFTRFGDTDMAQAIDKIVTATEAINPSIDNLRTWGELAADVAEATGRDLPAAADAVAMAASGQTRSLQRLIPAQRDLLREIEKLPTAAERGAAAVELLSEQFGGAARDIDPFELALARVNNGVSDLNESFGSMITHSSSAASSIATIADIIDDLAARIDPASESFDALGESIQGMAELGINSVAALVDFLLTSYVRLAQSQLIAERQLERRRQSTLDRGAQSGQDLLQAIDAGNVGATRESLTRFQAGGYSAFSEDDRRRLSELATRLSQSGRVGPSGDVVTPEERRLIESLTAGLSDIVQQSNTAVDELDSKLLELEAARVAALSAADRERRASARGSGRGDGAEAASGTASEGQDPKERELAVWAKERRALNEMLVALGELGNALDNTFEGGVKGADDLAKAFDNVAWAATEAQIQQAIAAQEQKELLEALHTQVSVDMVQAVGDLSAGLAVDITSALEAGDWDGFAHRALKAVSSMSKQIGAMYLATGIPLLIPGPLFNPAAGGAYIAYGGLLLAAGLATGALANATAPPASASSASARTGIEDNVRRDRRESDADARRSPFNILQIDTVVTRDAGTLRMLQEDFAREGSLGGMYYAA